MGGRSSAIHTIDDAGTHIFFHKGKNGAIATGPSYQKAKDKYIEMMKIAETVRDMLTYNRIINN